MNIAQLAQKYSIPGVAEIIETGGGLPAVVVKGDVEGEMYLHGAHVARWKPKGGGEILWMSGKSLFADGKPIRGGVPICFPWFGPLGGVTGAATHGFVRNGAWELESVRQTAAGVEVAMATRSNDQTRASWPHDFLLRHRVTFGSELAMTLELTNTGTAPLAAEEALHTYFTVGDIRRTRVRGLAGVRYVDKVDGRKEKEQSGDIDFTGETDRVYLNTASAVVIDDPVLKRQITIHKEGSRDTVVWNPWIAKARAMADFGDEEWPGMLCVETCNVAANGVRLKPGATAAMTARIEVRAL